MTMDWSFFNVVDLRSFTWSGRSSVHLILKNYILLDSSHDRQPAGSYCVSLCCLAWKLTRACQSPHPPTPHRTAKVRNDPRKARAKLCQIEFKISQQDHQNHWPYHRCLYFIYENKTLTITCLLIFRPQAFSKFINKYTIITCKSKQNGKTWESFYFSSGYSDINVVFQSFQEDWLYILQNSDISAHIVTPSSVKTTLISE